MEKKNVKRGIIDRFEGEYAVVEIEDEMRDIPRSKLPREAEVGDVLIFEGDQIRIAKDETEKLRKEIKELMDELFED